MKKENLEKITELRHELHRHAELSMEERETAESRTTTARMTRGRARRSPNTPSYSKTATRTLLEFGWSGSRRRRNFTVSRTAARTADA